MFGLADGFVIPTSQGLIPAVVSTVRLQQANALLGLSRSILGLPAPRSAGCSSPPAARAARCSSTLRASASPRCCSSARLDPASVPTSVEPEPFLASCAPGWQEFRRQTWIWTTIVFFGIGNCAATSLFVLGPIVAKRHYSGREHVGAC